MKILPLKKQILFSIVGLVTSLFFAGQALAVSITPANLNLSANLGDTLEGTITVGNSEVTVRELNLTTSDYVINPSTGTREFIDGDSPRGLKTWITLAENSMKADPDQTFDFKYTISIPEDADPGTYMGAFLAMATQPTESDGSSQVGVGGRVVCLVSVTIEGDYTEELELTGFSINRDQLLKGNINFEFDIKNKGTVKSAPTGLIKIYDLNNNQIKEIFAITKEFEGQKVITERKDEIPINTSSQYIFPNESKKFTVKWENRNIGVGIYKAGAELYYEDKKTLTAENLEFEILENFLIDELTPDAFFKTALPVTFTAKLRNTGATTLEPKGYFEITNIFGIQKRRVDFAKEELKIEPAQNKILNNLSWNNGFALGAYNASLVMDVGGKTYVKTTTFWVINPIQTGVLVVILALLIFVLVKGVIMYRKLKKKVKEIKE